MFDFPKLGHICTRYQNMIVYSYICMLVCNVAKHVRKYTKIPLAKYVLCLMLPTINASINYTKSPSIRKLIAKPVILNLKVYLNFWVSCVSSD